MELRHLRYFLAVAEELNFTQAAARLHMAQPPLSVQIRKLEAEVGAELFSRIGRRVTLTEAGKVFLAETRDILARTERSLDLARHAANGQIGHLTIGYNTVAEFKVFPTLVPAFRKEWPNVRFTFRAFEIAQQLEALRRDEVDVGFVWLPFPREEFDVTELTRATLVAVLPAKHRLAAMPTVSVKALSHEPLLMFSRALDPQTHHQIEELFLRSGATMNVALELDSLLSMLNFVAIGSGCALLPDYLQTVSRHGIVYRPLRPMNTMKAMAVVKRKGKAGLAERFYRFAIR